MSKDLEFHYVVSYREGRGWETAPELDQALFADGNVYDWDTNTWEVVGSIGLEKDVETLDNLHFNALESALNHLNEGTSNA